MAGSLVRTEEQPSGLGHCSVPASSIHSFVKAQNPSPLRLHPPSREDMRSATQYFSYRPPKETISFIPQNECSTVMNIYVFYIYIYSVFNPVQTGSSRCHKAGFNDFNVPFNSGFSSLELVSADVPLIVLCRISPWYFHHDGGSFLTYMRLCYTSFLSFDH